MEEYKMHFIYAMNDKKMSMTMEMLSFFFPFLKLTLLQVQEIRGYQNDYFKSRRTATRFYRSK